MPFSGFQDLNPDFARALQAYFAANPGLNAYSGYRTPEHQRQLFMASDRTGHSVGTPLGSQHVHRMAADLTFNGTRLDRLPKEQQQALQKSAAQFGLTYPMSWEAWHVEPVGARNSRAPTNVYDSAAAPVATPDDSLATAFQPAAQTDFNTSSDQTDQPRLRSSGAPPAPDLSEFNPSTPAPVAKAQPTPDLSPLASLFKLPAIGQPGLPEAGQPVAPMAYPQAMPRRRWE